MIIEEFPKVMVQIEAQYSSSFPIKITIYVIFHFFTAQKLQVFLWTFWK